MSRLADASPAPSVHRHRSSRNHGPLIAPAAYAYLGLASDVEIHAREILKTKETLNAILSKNTGQPMEMIQTDTERDFFMSGRDAKEYGIVDEAIATIKEPKVKQ